MNSLKSLSIKIILTIIATFAVILLVKSYLHLRADNQRITGNIELLHTKTQKFMTSDSVAAYKHLSAINQDSYYHLQNILSDSLKPVYSRQHPCSDKVLPCLFYESRLRA